MQRSKMQRLIRTLVPAAAGLVLGACAMTDESIDRQADVDLAPMPRPAEPLARSRGTNKGKPEAMRLLSVDGARLTYAITEGPDQGCEWTGHGWFAPATAWRDCGGSTGTQEIVRHGDIWPLRVGSGESYAVSGKDAAGERWQTTRECKVEAAVSVAIGEQRLPVYEVVCRDSWNTRTWYVSPLLQQAVKFRRWHHRRGLESDFVATLN